MAEPHFEKHVFICTNRREPGNPKGDCASKGGEAIKDEFKRLLHERGLKGRIRANAAGCHSRGGVDQRRRDRNRGLSQLCAHRQRTQSRFPG